jgi:hypothetical protein
MKKSEPFLVTVTLSDDSYSALLIKVQEWYGSLVGDWTIQASHYLSDRFAKKAYYFAVIKKTRQELTSLPKQG